MNDGPPGPHVKQIPSQRDRRRDFFAKPAGQFDATERSNPYSPVPVGRPEEGYFQGGACDFPTHLTCEGAAATIYP